MEKISSHGNQQRNLTKWPPALRSSQSHLKLSLLAHNAGPSGAPSFFLKVIVMQRKLVWSFLTLSCAAVIVACTAPDPGGSTTTGSVTTSSTGQTTASNTTGSTTATTGNTTGDIELTSNAETTDDSSSEETTARETECDANGENCVCIQLATWGGLGTFGAVPGADGQDAVVAWLNSNSTGEAEYFPTKPAINAEYLRNYDVIVIQNLELWPAFTAEEKAAFEAWVRAGGGVIALNGYSAQANEMANVNDLLAFSGMSFVPASDTANETQRATKLGVCQDCYGSAVPQGGWSATHPIGLDMKQVGAFHGRAVMGGTLVAQEFGATLGATAELDKGHVFFFHDEWVTYNSQWTGVGLPTNCTVAAMSGPNGECLLEHPTEQYTIPQFWYNSIYWAAGNPTCFVIEDDTIIIR